ncbi:uncharacterized protein Z518_05548 [Rhinocladiella mackenziei CBS 650.93]|uniref:FAM192A/Fyv6 N-terminal domain-containing protein n=1 Tax=Rhinocladiella mackenziei CBS 650.93 TaxID=1442369 RepID=A0A0D2H2L7_9EURO|nr:uncharacterized protein Z518_05548 [Rhinocladiella mackenziei CBS 650.93]KIX04678.1 hypothetical protein Z518_05548 [Rhinocladiella mackenziei CBS 650.93]
MSRFISAGTDADSQTPDDAWLKAQEQIESRRKPKAAEDGRQEGGKSLYEILQQNKAAKQEAFEESIKLKNQFRALDDDEVEFLDSVLESSRAKEHAVKQETVEQLEAFRKQRALADQGLRDQTASDDVGKLGTPVGASTWTMKKKKRRRDQERVFGRDPKSRKLSASTDENPPPTDPSKTAFSQKASQPEIENGGRSEDFPSEPKKDPPKASTIGLGLGDYDSDKDD